MITADYATKEFYARKRVGHAGWQRIILLCILGYEAAGCLLGGSLLVAAPDGRFMDMSVDIMHGVFPDFLIPGILLFSIGDPECRRLYYGSSPKPSGWIMAGLALCGLLIWFWIEIAILQQLHWLHAMWGLPVVMGGLVAILLFSCRERMLKALLICGILSSLLYFAINIIVPMQYPGYNSASQVPSELSAIGAPTRMLWSVLRPPILY